MGGKAPAAVIQGMPTRSADDGVQATGLLAYFAAMSCSVARQRAITS
jgi:hypothetical protein